MSQSKTRLETENRRLTAENSDLTRLVVRLVELHWGEGRGDVLEWPVEAGPQPSWWWAAVAL